MATSTTKTYDNSPEGIYKEARLRAERDIKQYIELVRALGVTEEQTSNDTVLCTLIDLKEAVLIEARSKYINPQDDKFSFANRRQVTTQPQTQPAPLVPTQPIVVPQAPVAPVAQPVVVTPA